jgi:DamX protein
VENPQPPVPSAPAVPAEQPAIAATKPSQPKEMPAAATQAAATDDLLGTEWLQSRPPQHFTLQLLGGRSEKSLRDYLRQNRVPDPVATFRTVFKGGNWFVLIHGDFTSMAEARAAIAALPANVRNGKPWARSFASVHTDIQKAKP